MNTILFPFKMNQDNKAAYVKAMDTAKQKGAKVIFLTTLPNLSTAEKDKVYFYLLALHGYYQTNHNNWQVAPKISTKSVLEIGDFDTVLQTFLNGQPVDWIVPTTAIQNQSVIYHTPSQIAFLMKHTRPFYPHLSYTIKRIPYYQQ